MNETEYDQEQARFRPLGVECLTILLAIILLAAGGQKLPGTDQMVAFFNQIGLGQWFRRFTAILEVTAAGLLVVSDTVSYYNRPNVFSL